MFRRFAVASPKAVLEVSQDCGWAQFNVNGHVEVTPGGQAILACRSPESALRLQLQHLISTYNPSWSPLLARGRAEAMRFLPIDVQQCFREADLLGSVSEDVVLWWDLIAQAARRQQDDKNLDVGRCGERLSIQFERRRTGTEPIWQALESNLSGYDILSVVGTSDTRPLRIEVKTSDSKPDFGEAYITRNEWNVAELAENYVFHFWALRPKPKLFIIDVPRMSAHIPEDQGSGQWENVRIPFVQFHDETTVTLPSSEIAS